MVEPQLLMESRPTALVVGLLPGALNGAVQVALGHPFDTLKTRMQAGGTTTAAPPAWTTVARELVLAEGLGGLYRGAVPPLFVTGSKRAVQMLLWEDLRVRTGSSGLAGALAGVAGTLVSCPLHVIKIEAQTMARTTTGRTTSPSSLAALRQLVFATDGTGRWSNLYRGFVAHAVRDVAFAGAYLGTYGALREQIPAQRRDPAATSWFALRQLYFPAAAVAASLVTWLVLLPLDTVKTIAQAGGSPGSFIRSATSQMRVRRMWRGIGPAMLRAGPVNGAAMLVYEAALPYCREEQQHKQT